MFKRLYIVVRCKFQARTCEVRVEDRRLPGAISLPRQLRLLPCCVLKVPKRVDRSWVFLTCTWHIADLLFVFQPRSCRMFRGERPHISFVRSFVGSFVRSFVLLLSCIRLIFSFFKCPLHFVCNVVYWFVMYVFDLFVFFPLAFFAIVPFPSPRVGRRRLGCDRPWCRR